MTTIAPPENLDEDAPVPVESILPKQCLDGSMLFEVPLNGTEEANFELASQ